MANKFNPFKPNHPIYTGLFAGRTNEIKKIDNALYQTSFDNPTNLLFVGERGIGKTSLLLLARYFAQGDIVWETKKHNFLTVQININSTLNSLQFILKFQNVLKRELHNQYKTQKIIEDFWGFIKRLEVYGCKINEKERAEQQIFIDDFVFSLIDTVKSIRDHKDNPKDGIIVLIDEADTSSDQLSLGALLKSISETLVAERCNRVLFILAGLPHVSDILRKSHESSPRLFEELTLDPLSFDDVKSVILSAQKEISNIEPEKNLQFDEEAIKLFHSYSEGYPHFLQQIGYTTIEDSTNSHITKDDVSKSMFRTGGALELIGNRYYSDLFYKKINVDSYRQILEIMAEKWNEWVSRKEIEIKFKGSKTVLNNGIKALRDRNIILSKRGVRGYYRLQWLSFAFWINIIKNKI